MCIFLLFALIFFSLSCCPFTPFVFQTLFPFFLYSSQFFHTFRNIYFLLYSYYYYYYYYYHHHHHHHRHPCYNLYAGYLQLYGARGSVVAKALRYKPAGRGFDSEFVVERHGLKREMNIFGTFFPYCERMPRTVYT
jgi:hypothetical protein